MECWWRQRNPYRLGRVEKNWCWQDPFEANREGHKLEGFPNTDGFRATTINLLKLAAERERTRLKGYAPWQVLQLLAAPINS